MNVFADREFIGEQWFTWLIEQDINFCIRVKNFIVTNHLGKNHKISDLFRHLKVGQIECRKRRILVGRVKLYKCTTVRKWRAFTRRFSSV
ncbi:Putative transposase (identified by ISEscan HMM) [Acinetobacter baumannii]|nr:Putative transposase (identified by ISEscan HMM) [Acinetobacter baumannii]